MSGVGYRVSVLRSNIQKNCAHRHSLIAMFSLLDTYTLYHCEWRGNLARSGGYTEQRDGYRWTQRCRSPGSRPCASAEESEHDRRVCARARSYPFRVDLRRRRNCCPRHCECSSHVRSHVRRRRRCGEGAGMACWVRCSERMAPRFGVACGACMIGAHHVHPRCSRTRYTSPCIACYFT